MVILIEDVTVALQRRENKQILERFNINFQKKQHFIMRGYFMLGFFSKPWIISKLKLVFMSKYRFKLRNLHT
jgi:hypothetical protein